MKSNFTIFYSWQSDISTNRNAIADCIKKAIKSVKKELTTHINLEIDLDRDTQNQVGSIDIGKTILQKISISDIFICDVTIINKTGGDIQESNRLTPNPNVLFELGFAVNQLGWERIICLYDLNYGKPEELPFDIRNHRIITFDSSKTEFKKELTSKLTSAIRKMIEDYDRIEVDFNLDRLIQHDIKLFEKQDTILPETLLNDSLSSAVISLFSDRYYYTSWDSLVEFYSATKNHFLNKELHEIFTEYLSAIQSFKSFCVQNLTKEKIDGVTIRELRMSGKEISEEEEYQAMIDERFFAHKEPFRTETWEDADKRIWKIQDEFLLKENKVKDLYKKFIVAFTTLKLKK